MYTYSIFLISLLLANRSLAFVDDHTLPPTFTIKEIGTTNDTAFPNVYRDGGGGGLINGENVIVFSDTSTTTGGPSGSLKYFTSNSIAYVYNLVTFVLALLFMVISPNDSILTRDHSLMPEILQALSTLAQMESRILEFHSSQMNLHLLPQTGKPIMNVLPSGQAVSRSFASSMV